MACEHRRPRGRESAPPGPFLTRVERVNPAAPRRRCIAFPAKPGGTGGTFLGQMAYLDPKGEGNCSMPENRRSGPYGWDDAPGGPRDMAKSGLTKTKSPGMQIHHPPESRLKPAPQPCIGIARWSMQPPGCGRCPTRAFEEMSWTPKSCCYVRCRRSVGSPNGCEP